MIREMISMKKRISRIVYTLSALLISAALTSCASDQNEAVEFYNANKSELEAAVAEILASQSTDGVELDGVASISYYQGDDAIIEFEVYASGLVPSSTYGGIYYSVDGEPAGFQNVDVTLNETDDGWEWQGDGDNHGITTHIEGNWYTYEASF